MKKYKLIDKTKCGHGNYVYRIQALRDFGAVHAGDIGGYVTSEDNLSHDGLCWLFDEAKALGNSRVCGDALLYDYAVATDYAIVYGNAVLRDHAEVAFFARVYGEVTAQDYVCIAGYAQVGGRVILQDEVCVNEEAVIIGTDILTFCGNMTVQGDAFITNSNNKVAYLLCSKDSSTCLTFYTTADNGSPKKNSFENSVIIDIGWKHYCLVSEFLDNILPWIPEDVQKAYKKAISNAKRDIRLDHSIQMYT